MTRNRTTSVALALVLWACTLAAAAQAPGAACPPAGCAPLALRLDEGFLVSRQRLADLPAAPVPAAQADREPAAVPVPVAGTAPSTGASVQWLVAVAALAAGMLLQRALQSAFARRRIAAPIRAAERPQPALVAPPPPEPVVEPLPVEEAPAPMAMPEPIATAEPVAMPEPASMPGPVPAAPLPQSSLAPPEGARPAPAPVDEQTVTLLKRLAARRAASSQQDDRFSAVFRLIALGRLQHADEALTELETPLVAPIPPPFLTTGEHIALRRDAQLQRRLDDLRERVHTELGGRRLAVAEAFLRRKRLDQAAEVLDELEADAAPREVAHERG